MVSKLPLLVTSKLDWVLVCDDGKISWGLALLESWFYFSFINDLILAMVPWHLLIVVWLVLSLWLRYTVVILLQYNGFTCSCKRRSLSVAVHGWRWRNTRVLSSELHVQSRSWKLWQCLDISLFFLWPSLERRILSCQLIFTDISVLNRAFSVSSSSSFSTCFCLWNAITFIVLFCLFALIINFFHLFGFLRTESEFVLYLFYLFVIAFWKHPLVKLFQISGQPYSPQ